MASDDCRDDEAPLASWHLKRLRCIAAGPRLYGRWDTVNAFLMTRGLIAATERDAGPHKREYAITEAGRAALPQSEVDYVDRRRKVTSRSA